MTAPNHIVGGITLTGICGGFMVFGLFARPLANLGKRKWI